MLPTLTLPSKLPIRRLCAAAAEVAQVPSPVKTCLPVPIAAMLTSTHINLPRTSRSLVAGSSQQPQAPLHQPPCVKPLAQATPRPPPANRLMLHCVPRWARREQACRHVCRPHATATRAAQLLGRNRLRCPVTPAARLSAQVAIAGYRSPALLPVMPAARLSGPAAVPPRWHRRPSPSSPLAPSGSASAPRLQCDPAGSSQQ